MLRKLTILFLFLVVLVACGGEDNEPAEETQPTATVEVAVQPSSTPLPPPTNTPLPPPTETPAPTETAVPTNTPEPTATPIPQDTWTILVYLDADNNLEEPGLYDMNEMEAAGSSDDVNVLVQIDRISGETSADGNWTDTRRYRMEGDNNLDKISSPVLMELGELNMGDPATLTDFMVWGMTEYPAQHYALVLWDHGAGWFGVAFDDTTSDGDGLTLPELDGAITQALQQTGVEKLDIIGFDACLMGQLDVYFAMQELAHYAVGSEELVPGLGWDYTAILERLYEEPDMSGEEWAGYLVSDFINFYTKIEPDEFVTMSAVDLGKFSQLTDAMLRLSQALQTNPAFHASAVGDARGGAEGYALVYPEDAEYYAAIDLWHFASILSQRSPDEQVIAAAKEVMTAVESTVLAADHGDGFTHAKGIALYFPRTADYLSSRYRNETPLNQWGNFLTKFHAGLEDIPHPEFHILNILSSQAGVQQPTYLDVEITGTDIQNVFLIGGQYENGRQRLLVYDFLIPEPTYLEDGSLLYEWRDGVHQDFFIWDTQSPYVYDNQGNGDYVVMSPTEYDSPLYTVQGRFRRDGADKYFESSLVFNTDTGQVAGVWTYQGDSGSAPNEVLPKPGDEFQLYDVYLDGETTFVDPGATLLFDENGQLYYTWLPLPSGEYFLGFSAKTIAGETAEAFADFTVDNDNLVEGYTAYLDPYKGFQFLYPTSWYAPSYEDALLYTYDIDTATTQMNIILYPEADGATAEILKAQTIETYGDLDYFFEDSLTIGGVDGLITGYRYEAENGTHTGFFLTFVFEDTGYVVDVDGLQENEQETAESVDMLIASWVFQPVGFGLQPGNWATVELDGFSVEVPSDFQYEETESGWQLFSAEDGYSFVALRTDPASGDDLQTVILDWAEVAAEGFDDFSYTDPYDFSLDNKAWSRVDFSYTAEDGTFIWGMLLVTVVDDQEITAWAEAPQDVYLELESSVFLVTISDLALEGETAESTPTPEPTTEPTTTAEYIETFDETGDWGVGDTDEVLGQVVDGVYDFAVFAENALYWTTAGQNFGDGVYEVQGTAVGGNLDNGFGMIFRSNNDTDDFYVFEISSDGYVWIGLCLDGCSETDVLNGGWFASDAVNQGLNATNFLRVIANGPNMAFFVNGVEVGHYTDATLPVGDIGLLVETFDDSGVHIQFDNFMFTPGGGKQK